jgi:hypothetical protein
VKSVRPALDDAPVGRGKESPFYVPPVLDLLGAWVEHQPQLWIGLGRLESSLLAQRTRSVAVRKPVYVCGLARSGSTLLHEVLASCPGVTTYRVKDFPMVFTPYWWRQATAGLRPTAPRERAHRDRIHITLDSPEALEEMLWMAFFPRCHDPSVSGLLGAGDSHPTFETFYRDHVRKLLLAEGGTRYVAKANYHVARLGYLARLFPDARFLLPVRSPVSHIASLARQHRWFSRGQRTSRRARAYMRRSGHFEFGLDRRPMNLGDGEQVAAIERAWANGEEVRGWARSWDMVYGHLARLLASDSRVRDAVRVVRFEALCADPADTLREVLAHCDLSGGEGIIEPYAAKVRLPDYYEQRFSGEELAVIHEETAGTAGLWGYESVP